MKGIDLSKHNEVTDYDLVARDIDFAILRVGYGVEYLPDSQKDKKFDDYYNGFKGKVKIGAYYYAYANEKGEGKKEAENCLKYLNGKSLDLPIFYDLEDKTLKNIEIIAREFVDTIKAAGYKAGIYTNLDWATHKIDLSKFNDCSIWIARFGRNDGNIPSTEPPVKWDFWQYTSVGKIKGIKGYVDLNISRGHVDLDIPEKGEIAEVQQWCYDYGYRIAVDNKFGPETKKALIKILQSEMNKHLSEIIWIPELPKNTWRPLRIGMHGILVKVVQGFLICYGFDTSEFDSIFGSGTENAVKQYQKSNNLVVDGIVGKKTILKMTT